MSDTIFKRPIVIYSAFCNFSNNFLKILIKYPDLYNSFIRMNIDVDESTRKRPEMFYKIQEILGRKISKVPTIITPGAEHVLSDQDAFKWLEFQVNNLTKEEKGLLAFNPGEMTSFSDHYAKFGSTELNDANEQNYKFFVDVNNNNGQTEKILPDDNYLNTNKSWDVNSTNTNGFLNELEENSQNTNLKSVESEREYFDQHQQKQRSTIGAVNFKDNNQKINTEDFNSFSQNRQQPTVNKQTINFTDSSFGLAGKLGSNQVKSGSIKSKELDNKLLSLQKDREMMDNTLNQRKRI